MEDLIKKIVDGTGTTPEQARKAIELVREELKLRFPTILHEEIDNAIHGGKFGNSYREKAENLKEKIEVAAKEAGAKAETLFSEIRDRVNEIMHSTKNTNPPK